MSYYKEYMANILFTKLHFQIKYIFTQKLFIVWISIINRGTVKYENNVYINHMIFYKKI